MSNTHSFVHTLYYKVTALLHGDRDPSIAGMVLDSPFADLTQLCEEMVEKARDHGISKSAMHRQLNIYWFVQFLSF